MRRTIVVALTVVLTAASTAVVLTAAAHSPQRIVAALLLVLVLPGLAALLLLRSTDRPLPRPPDGLLLVPALSIAIVILDSAGMYVSGIRLDLHSWTISLAVITASLTIAGAVRLALGRRVPDELAGSRRPRGRRQLIARGAHTLVLVEALLIACGMLAGAGALTYASVNSRNNADRFSQLWLLPSASGSRSATVGIFNHQGATVSYRLEVSANGHEIRSQRVNLANGASWQISESYPSSTATLRALLTSPGGARQSTMLHIYPRPRSHRSTAPTRSTK